MAAEGAATRAATQACCGNLWEGGWRGRRLGSSQQTQEKGEGGERGAGCAVAPGARKGQAGGSCRDFMILQYALHCFLSSSFAPLLRALL